MALNKYLWLCGALPMALLACSDDSDDGNGAKPDVPPAEVAEVTVDAKFKSLRWSYDGGKAMVSASTKASQVTVTPLCDWLTCGETSSGLGKCYFDVVCAELSTNETRKGAVVVSTASHTDTVYVTQAGKPTTTAVGLVSQIVAGFNIGNTFEVPNGDYPNATKIAVGGWGAAIPGREYLRTLKSLGFNAIRIPCAWHSYSSGPETGYRLPDFWMNAVRDMVDLCLDEGFIVMLNSHWDTGWLENHINEPGPADEIDREQRLLWTQIATAFRDYDERLIFAGCNEPGYNEANDGIQMNDNGIARLKRYEKTFIDAVRATGGNNALRCLVVQGPSTNIDQTCKFFTELPEDVVEGRLILEVHYYDPYNFCGMQKDESWGNVAWYWGKDNHKSGSRHNSQWGEEEHAEGQFKKMYDSFCSKGIPVVIGEFSSQIQPMGKKDDNEQPESIDMELHKKSRADWNEVNCRLAKKYGCAPFYWETGSEINRTTGAISCDYSMQALVKGAEQAYPYAK